jgi:hypothetical protein
MIKNAADAEAVLGRADAVSPRLHLPPANR